MSEVESATNRIGVVIEAHPYDEGYWRRYNGGARPRRGERRQGWDACDREMKREAERARDPETKP